MDIHQRIAQLDWTGITQQLNEKGYSSTRSVLTGEECAELIDKYIDEELFRKTINMERYRFGMGEYKYYRYPLPALVQKLRESVYPQLAPVANTWMKALSIEKQYPENLNELLGFCHTKGQDRPTPLILKYGEGGYNTLHQDLYGEVYFPMQLVLFLNEPGIDYNGGEFVLIEQRPRAQSKAIVLTPKKGDMMIFATNYRPVKGSKGHYRVNMKHGVSEISSGNRHTVGIIFHDAL